MKNLFSRYVPFVLLSLNFLAVIWLYKDSLGSYFFQDDWFTLNISRVSKFSDLLHFFIPRTDVIYYRPLGMQIPFYLLANIFGLHPYFFHIFIILVHLLNSFLVYKFVRIITSNIFVASLSSFLFSTSSIHFIPFWWLSTMAFPLGLTWMLTALILYLRWFEKKNRVYLDFFLITYILALLTNELSILIPFLIIIHQIIFSKIKNHLFPLLLIPLVFYGFARIFFKPAISQSYELALNFKSLKILIVYYFWLLNWPEEIRNQLENLFKLNFNFFGTFRVLTGILLAIFILLNALIYKYLTVLIKNPINKTERKVSLFAVCMLAIGIIPLLFFPQHTYPYYLSVSSVGLSILIALSLNKRPYAATIAVLVLWIVSNKVSVTFSELNHWTTKRSQISRLVTSDFMKRYPNIEEKKIYIYNDPELKVILSGQDAFRVLYNNTNISTIYYGAQDPIWKNVSEENKNIQLNRLKLNYLK